MWAEESVMYQIYPLGMCGAPFENPAAPGEPVPEEASVDGSGAILQVLDWIPHLKKLHVGTVLFNPLFESDTHGYNTRDFFRVDRRLGTNGDFKKVCEGLHEAGIHVMLDGVFNHVGRGFFAFQDVLQKKWDSPYKDWFHINFDGNDAWNDGLWYEGWEGNYDLVKLNLNNEAVVNHLLDAVRFWAGEFGIDGLRLDVAYCLDRGFLRRLRAFTESLTAELGREEPFFLFGEILGGDYKTIMAPDMLHSATNYECCKGLYSSFNSSNLFEINHSLIRQFGSDPWCLYRGMHLVSFADNHDITRIASVLNNPAHLPLLYALMFGMPGIPCIYYGSEWGMKGEKRDGDPALRPAVREPEWNELTDFIAQLAAVKRESEALCYGEFRSVLLTNKQCIFERRSEHERVLVAINMDDADYTAHFDAGCGMAVDLISGRDHDFGGGSVLPACSAQWWRMER
ncbi:MAG: cyclomaltodextrinase [Lachnospiraceae bacterium]|nr:cyclomaltodextrinase [Lachnospiraceae bacterium]